jgi:hemolysin activation/secretion protein
VVEAKVGRLRVRGARYFLPDSIKKKAPSLAEGTVPNFTDVTRDIVALNRFPDLQVTPVLQPGIEPGTVDIDLNVKDKLPLHASLELNNRHSPDTTALRVNGSISYNNLWQLGHSAGFSFQLAPERLEDAEVFSAYYIAPVPGVDGLSLMLQGTKQDSNVSTLGGAAVAGRGHIVGLHALVSLPPGKDFFHSLSLGIDYKHFDEDLILGVDETATPIDYYPISASYGATWTGKNAFTELNAALNFHLRGMGSKPEKFDAKRFNADGGYLYFRGDLSHTHDLPGGFQVFGKVQGQIASAPLINSEQFAGGGLATARGYLESTALGDNGIFGTLELRTPSIPALFRRKGNDTSGGQKSEATEEKGNEWRFHVFCDAGRLTLNDPLPEQEDRFDLASCGVGSRFRFMNHLNGSIDAAWPLISQSSTMAHDLFVTFRVWTDF